MNNNEVADIFQAILEQQIEKEKRAYRQGQSSLCSTFDIICSRLGIPFGDIDPVILDFTKAIARKSFKKFLSCINNDGTQDTNVYSTTEYVQSRKIQEEWLIMGFSSTDNLFANSEHISVDEKTIRGAIVFWTGDDTQFRSIKNIIDDKQIDANTNELFGAFTLYAVKIHSHGELYRGAKEDDRYMISVKIISCCKENNIDLTAMHLGHISSDVAQANGFFSLV